MRRTLHLNHRIPTGTLLLWLTCLPIAGHAQVAPITPSGLNTQVNLAPTPPAGKVQYDITGGTRPGGGTNLFHSFGEFNVPNNNIANFFNDSGLATSTILGRVTGGDISNIFGTIQTTGFGNTNLFMMNPAGFLFGPNATIAIGGMVAFTSADYLRLADGKLFNATPSPTADALLSTAPVAAYGFLGTNPGAITIQGSQLTVTPGQSLSLAGGDITIQSGTLDNGTVHQANLSAVGGQIHLASVASPGEILTANLAQTPNINGESFGNLGAIQISEQSVIDVSGNGGGTVLIRGGQFLMDSSMISANVTSPGLFINGVESIGGGIDIQVTQNAVIQPGSLFETNVLGNATSGITYRGTHIKADRIEIIGDPGFDFENGPFTEIRSDVGSGSTGGNSGNISLEANSILLQDFVTLGTSTNGTGNAGHIKLQTNDNLELNGSILETISLSVPGNAGNIDLLSAHGNIFMTNGPVIQSQNFGTGNVGHITVTAPEGQVLLSNFDIFAGAIFIRDQGTAGIAGTGGIQITAKDLTIVNSGIQIDNFTSVQPGDLTVDLSGRLTMTGSADSPQATLLTTTRRDARSADLNISAHDILLSGNSLVSSETFRDGDAGPLNILTQNLELTTGAQIRSSSRFNPAPSPGDPIITPSGAGGTVTIQGLGGPTQSVLIDGSGSGIFTDTQGAGAGGNISVNANSVTLSNGGALSAATSGSEPSATGGTITVNANTVNLNAGGTMTAASTGAGAAGDITVQGLSGRADAVLISGMDENFNPSGIFTDTQGTGAGGNIFVNANSVTLQDGSTFSAATAGTGDAGNINIAADALTLNGFSNIRANTEFGSQGKGGNVTAQVREASLNGGSTISTGTFGLGDAGEITIQATERITMSDFSGISSFAFDFGTGAGNAGLIHLTAPTIQLNGGSINSLSQGPGNAGEIILDANTIMMGGNQNSIVSQTGGTGRGGDISIQGLGGPGNRTSDFTISDGSTITSSSSGDGRAGDISILTERITLTNSGMNSSAAAAGNAGNITIDASESVHVSTDSLLLSSSSLDATGNAGQITILTPSLTVDGGGVVSTSTNGTGNAGSITVNATSVNLLSGGQLSSTSSVDPLALNSPLPTGSAGTVTIQGLANPAQSVLIDGPGSGVFTDTSGTGAGGNIVVNANAITLQNGGTLSAITSGSESSAAGGTITVYAGQVQVNSGALITASTTGAGAGGSINIGAASTFAMNGGTVSSSATEAAGGDINISTGQSVTLDNGSLITASSNGDGNAGNILINAGQQYRSINSSVTTKAEEASGGNITVLATGLVHLTNSELNASVEGSSTTVGGNILIDPVYVILENSQILAQATQGQGGNINIFYSGAFLVDPSSLISASSQFGQSGTVTIQSPISPASGKIIPLGQKPLIVTSLLSQRCAALAGGNISSFTIAGRESLPAEPGSLLSSPLALTMSESEDGAVREADGTMADETPLLSLRKIAPPGFLTHAFAVDWSPGCSS